MQSAPNISSEEELSNLRKEGKVSEDEYKDLLAAIKKSPVERASSAVNTGTLATPREVPWQIWVVVALLALEGVGNLLIIPNQPVALIWLGVKCLFILGLLKRWRWVFCLSVVIGSIHVLFFMLHAPLVALINLLIIVLILSSFRFYFPSQAEYDDRLSEMKKKLSGG